MTRQELDVMWSIATGKSIEENEPFTRYEFAKMVAAAEREACAKVCEEFRDVWLKGLGRYEFMGEGADLLADFIRARGETK
jgi:hypothetical protein